MKTNIYIFLKPRLKTLEDPLIDVTELESKPPVHDSANDTFRPFFLNNFTSITNCLRICINCYKIISNVFAKF